MDDETKRVLAEAFKLYLAQNGYTPGTDNCDRMEHALMAGAISYAMVVNLKELSDPDVVTLSKHLMMQRSFVASFATVSH